MDKSAEAKTAEQESITELYAKGLWDIPFFCKYFLEAWFSGPIPPFHRGVMAILFKTCKFLEDDPDLDWIIENFVYFAPDDSKEEHPFPIFVWDEGTEGGDRSLGMVLGDHTLMLIPRGFAKTTMENAATVHKIVYKTSTFSLYISKTAKHSTKQLKAITSQLTLNKRIISVFGALKPAQRKENNLTWSESDGLIQTTNGFSLASIGAGGQARGQLIEGERPQDIVLDDLQDREAVKSAERRKDLEDWLVSDVEPALNMLNPESSITMLANLTHADCLAAVIATDPDWTVLRFGALDRAGKPLWEALWSEEKIEKRKQNYARRGKLHIFYMEYFNVVRAPEDASFKPAYIHIAPKSVENFTLALAVDPAISDKAGADYMSYAVAGMEDGGNIQIFESFSKKGIPTRAQVDKYFEIWARFKPVYSGVESVAYQKALVHLIREEMFRKSKEYGFNVYHQVEPIQHSNQMSKFERVEGILQPRYAAGYIHHQMHFPILETQLLDWPNGKLDAPDAVAMAVSLLDPLAGLAGADNPEEDEYEPLAVVMGGDWRRYK